MKTRQKIGVALGALCCPWGAAWAQDINGANNKATIETVTVTATKRQENLEKVPIAVTALSNQDLKNFQTKSQRDLVYQTPSLNYTKTDGLNDSYSVRGIGTLNASSFALEDSVAVFVDGIAMIQGTGAQPVEEDFSDVDQVEVLRGPQGLLFGKNSDAGLIQYTTRKPEIGETESDLHLSYGMADVYHEYIAQGGVDLPAGDDAAFRFNGYYENRTGDVLNVLNGQHLNGAENYGGAAKLVWQPNDQLNVYVKLDGGIQHANIAVTTPYIVPPGALADYYASFGIVPGINNRRTVLDGPNFGKMQYAGALVQIDYRLDDVTLTSLSGFRYSNQIGNLDTDGTAENEFDINSPHSHVLNYSEEFRVASNDPGYLQYVAGFYWQKSVDRADDHIGLLSLWDFTEAGPSDFNNYGVFGEATFNLANDWRVRTGARETLDDNTLFYNLAAAADSLPPSIIGFPAFSKTYNESKWGFTGRVSVEHDFDEGTMGYFTFTKGYKGPGFNTQALKPDQDPVVGAESPYSYELGAKSTTLIPDTRLNVAVFDTEFKNYQAEISVNTPALGFIDEIQNAGSLSTRGLELEFATYPIEGLSFNGGFTWQVAKYEDLPNQSCYVGQTAAQGCINGLADASGHDLINAPKFLATINGTYSWQIANGTTAYVDANYYYRTKSNFSDLTDPRKWQAPFGIFGATVGIRRDSWTLGLWAKNLFDQRFIASINGIGNFDDSRALQIYHNPESYRSFGLTLDVNL